jgi:nucleoid-associated protein YgaU
MTRETKIGLLVGLAFIIVIGILLSDHFSSSAEPTQAALSGAAASVRQAVNSPGSASPPITMVVPKETPPTQAVPTHDELTQPPSPVIPSSPNRSETISAAPQPSIQSPPAMVDQPDQVAGADAPSNAGEALAQAARQHGESVVPSNIDGSSKSALAPTQSDASGPRSYRAQSGDSVSRMAARLMGSNTRANRQAIIDANPSLQQDPDRVIVGQTYTIPGRAVSSASAPPAGTAAPAPAPALAAGNVYTVQEGDSLWRIANDQLGDPSAIDTIKQLNMDVLKGDDHDVITPGMKLRLPGKPVASAN